ncbi:hypothetical protein EV359DRAFT_63365 [Lentinula novae-zelandiae]|nr:hypothetical protein EV359DRAFT_63365 [Lentinula novae-zelandiae]
MPSKRFFELIVPLGALSLANTSPIADNSLVTHSVSSDVRPIITVWGQGLLIRDVNPIGHEYCDSENIPDLTLHRTLFPTYPYGSLSIRAATYSEGAEGLCNDKIALPSRERNSKGRCTNILPKPWGHLSYPVKTMFTKMIRTLTTIKCLKSFKYYAFLSLIPRELLNIGHSRIQPGIRNSAGHRNIWINCTAWSSVGGEHVSDKSGMATLGLVRCSQLDSRDIILYHQFLNKSLGKPAAVRNRGLIFLVLKICVEVHDHLIMDLNDEHWKQPDYAKGHLPT